jgi:hypothetical protein
LCNFKRHVGRNGLPTLTHDILDKLGDIPPCQRNVLDATSNDISVCREKGERERESERAREEKEGQIEKMDTKIREKMQCHWIIVQANCYARRHQGVVSYPSATGMTWVTPSPESITVPVRVLFFTSGDVHDAARARTACTAM